MSEPLTDLPPRIVVDQHGHYWRDYGDMWSMCPVSDENVDTEPVAIYSRESATPPLDVDALQAAILDELAQLWGEPADAVSQQVRPQVARSIASRYAARLAQQDGTGE